MALPQRKVEYPSSDGHPMTDKDLNRLLMEYAEFAIGTKFEADPTAYVSANLFVFYEEGNKNKRVSPDTFLVRGVGRGLRDNYLIWEEGRAPEVVFEFVARASFRMDPEVKRDIYERIGVLEYYVFDPLAKWLNPPLWAYRLENGRFREMPQPEGEITSPILGLRMRVEGNWLRFYDAESGQPMPTQEEMRSAGRRDAERARQEAERARQEAERANREAERAKQEAERANQEAERANQEAERARTESERARQFEQEVERLRRQLGETR